MSDLTDSFKEIFRERISSPFYGSLIVSWLLWNWKIPYVTFFIDQSRLGDATNKIDYIFKHCDSIWLLLIGPLASTGAIIFLLPYITNYAFKVTAKFDRKRKDVQIEIDRTQLLTIEQSVQLLTDIQKQKDSFRNLLSDKDEQIKLLTKQLESATKPKVTGTLTDKKDKFAEECKVFLENTKVSPYIEQIDDLIRTGYSVTNNITKDIVNYYQAYELIETLASNFILTEKGKYFLKEYLKQKVNKK